MFRNALPFLSPFCLAMSKNFATVHNFRLPDVIRYNVLFGSGRCVLKYSD